MVGTKHLMGVDPGFASFGYTVVELHASDISIVEMGVLRTKKSSVRARIFQADDNHRRCCELAEALYGVLEGREFVAICGESFSAPRNASAGNKVAMAWGVLGAICTQYKLPMIQMSPQRLKEKICGPGLAGKQFVTAAVKAKFPDVDFEKLLEKLPLGQYEHAWDALACVIASLDAEAIRLVRRFIV